MIKVNWADRELIRINDQSQFTAVAGFFTGFHVAWLNYSGADHLFRWEVEEKKGLIAFETTDSKIAQHVAKFLLVNKIDFTSFHIGIKTFPEAFSQH